MTCTCAGTAPGYPQHESYCGQPEANVLTEANEAWLLEHSTPVATVPVYYSATGKADPDYYRDEYFNDWLATLDFQHNPKE